jgi:hypothetical protein
MWSNEVYDPSHTSLAPSDGLSLSIATASAQVVKEGGNVARFRRAGAIGIGTVFVAGAAALCTCTSGLLGVGV